MTLSSVRTKHWTRAEYERLVDLGAFRPGERLDPDAPYGWRYGSMTTLRGGDVVAPLALPRRTTPVSDLLL